MVHKPRHTPEFRAALNKQIKQSGYSPEEIAKYLRVSAQVLVDWLQESDEEIHGRYTTTIGDIRSELARAKAELKLAKEEREILRKISALYAKKKP